MNTLSMFHDDVRREICNRCEYLYTTTPDGRRCSRAAEVMVAIIVNNFSQNPDTQTAPSDEEVSIDLGQGVNFISTKERLIDSLASVKDEFAAVAESCTSLRSRQFIDGTIENFEPEITYSRDEIMLSISCEL